MKNLVKNVIALCIAFFIVFSIAALVYNFAPTKVVADKEYKLVFGALIETNK